MKQRAKDKVPLVTKEISFKTCPWKLGRDGNAAVEAKQPGGFRKF
jgi:hypothetical protein